MGGTAVCQKKSYFQTKRGYKRNNNWIFFILKNISSDIKLMIFYDNFYDNFLLVYFFYLKKLGLFLWKFYLHFENEALIS